MIMDSVVVSLLGMGVVFVFLAVMIAAMGALQSLLPFLARISPEEPEHPGKHKHHPGGDAAAAAAIALAWHSNSGRHS